MELELKIINKYFLEEIINIIKKNFLINNIFFFMKFTNFI